MQYERTTNVMWRQQDWSLFVEQDYLQLMSKFGAIASDSGYAQYAHYLLVSTTSFPNSAIYYMYIPTPEAEGLI